MTYKQALKASKHNPAEVVKVLRELDHIYRHKGKILYSYTPEFGQMVVYKKKVALITGVNPLKENGQYDILLQISSSGIVPEIRAKVSGVIPILPWEEIRRIVKQAGYSISITSGATGGEIVVYKEMDIIYKKYHNNNLQEAVMKAVIELGKET